MPANRKPFGDLVDDSEPFSWWRGNRRWVIIALIVLFAFNIYLVNDNRAHPDPAGPTTVATSVK